MSGAAGIHPLAGNQARAVAPEDSVWLSASAGTGKTQVLSARVLRLLLQPGTRPEAVLCLTFTKAGAAEMAARINQTLARWVRLDSGLLGRELEAIGAVPDPATRARARTLFAQVLDCPGGGLRIDTIHAFSQWLLAAFPEEAGLAPGTRPLEEREGVLLARQVLGDLLTDAAASGDPAPGEALAALSLRWGEGEVESFLLRCARAHDLWHGPGSWVPPLGPRVHQLLGLPVGYGEADLAALCGDEQFPVEALRLCLAAYAAWNGKKGQAGRAVIADWLAAGEAARLGTLDDLHKVLFTQKDTVRDQPSLEKFEADFGDAAAAVLAASLKVRAARALLDLAQRLTPALELGRRFALAWAAAKAREGVIDFDDQIRAAAALLSRSAMADWIRYKLDRRFDHVLVDEAQDTNVAQWRIVKALTDDFFAGEGQRGDLARTLFVVGDYKQAIFGFQGTSPDNFAAAAGWFRAVMRAAAGNDRAQRGPARARELVELGLGQSFRTARPVLEFVDRAIAHLGPQRFGLGQADPHQGQERPGHVALWQPVSARRAADDDEEGDWFAEADRELADRIARQVRGWLDHGFPLVKGGARRAGPGDIMVLVRKRRALAGLIVARLHAARVPVAGVDRLRLGAPLAVKDLIAALRFAAQPLDDLNLASLLVSPLVGWSQDQLLAHGWREQGHLWSHLRASADPLVAATVEQLNGLLARADYVPVQALLHWLLAGPWQARARLVARLGEEVGDPVDELLNAAHAFAATGTPGLHAFLQWFDAGDGELKREADGASDLVRVMTVHGSKGLQAPIVILADATGNPAGQGAVALDLDDPEPGRAEDAEPRKVPLPALKADERLGRIAAAAEAKAAAEEQEHWRLLYVAMTRAEEALFVTGALGARETAPAPDSWYARLAELWDPADWVEDPIWGARAELAPLPPAPPRPPEEQRLDVAGAPGWLRRPVGEEPRPPRPLAPSALGEDLAADPPVRGAGQDAARRGVLLHGLLERLPAVAEDRRAAAAQGWLARHGADLEPMVREELAAAALATVSDPRWAELFGPDALAEVPIAATVGGQVVAGTIDRLLVRPDRVRLVDFKTSRRPPPGLEQVHPAHLAQMAAYAAALEASYPGRRIEVALLYTHAPRLIELPEAALAPHKARLLGAE